MTYLSDKLGERAELTIPILIVEDEPLISMDLQAAIEDHGDVAVIADSLEKSREAMAQHTFSWAILDLNLGNTSTMPIAEELATVGTKICFVTGSDVPQDTLNRLDAKLLSKPIDLRRLIDLIKQ